MVTDVTGGGGAAPPPPPADDACICTGMWLEATGGYNWMQNQYVGMIPSTMYVCVCVCIIDDGVGWCWDSGALTGEAFQL